MARPTLTLYYDLHSPYAYVAFNFIKNSPIYNSCDVTYIPVLLVAFVKAIGLTPPWSSPNKVNWLATDVKRACRDFDIPWQEGWPPNYPFKATTLKVQRVLMACSIECPDQYTDVISALYHAFWYEKKSVQLPEIYEPIVTQVLGREKASKVFARGSTEEIKEALKKNTEQALNSGAPGLPWIKVVNAQGQEEWYWGSDRLDQATRFMGLGSLKSIEKPKTHL